MRPTSAQTRPQGLGNTALNFVCPSFEQVDDAAKTKTDEVMKL